jgi:hypothetical protein
VAVRQGLQAKSFDLAAESYCEAVGGRMSSDSLGRVTEGWGQLVEDSRKGEAGQVYAAKGPLPAEQVVTIHTPIQGQANISTDGGMILLREEGWKEAKMSVFSEVKVSAGLLTSPKPDPQVALKQHSYQVGLWDADEMGQHQYLEGTRRQVEQCQRISSVNDGAPWIERITASNYSQAIQIIDWGHADERLWKVAKAAFGEGSLPTQHWAEQQIDHLWHGRVEDVLSALHALDWSHITCLDEVRQSPAYFETRQSKMSYDLFRQEGLPIGSGTVESGINTVVHHRMKRPGRGWKRPNAQAMLAALSELHSARFQVTWLALLPAPN